MQRGGVQTPSRRQSFGPTLMQAAVPPHQSLAASSNGQLGHLLLPSSVPAAFIHQEQLQQSAHLSLPLISQQQMQQQQQHMSGLLPLPLGQKHQQLGMGEASVQQQMASFSQQQRALMQAQQQQHFQQQASLARSYQQPLARLSALLPPLSQQHEEAEELRFTADLMPAAWGSIDGGLAAAAAVPAALALSGGGSAQGTAFGYGGERAQSRSGGSWRRGKKVPVVAKLPPWAGAGWDPHTAGGTRSGGTGVFLPNTSRTRCGADSIVGAAAASGDVGSGGKVTCVSEVSRVGGTNAEEPAAVQSPSAPLPKLAVAEAAAAGGGSNSSGGSNSISDEHLSPIGERFASPCIESAATDTIRGACGNSSISTEGGHLFCF